MNADSIVRVIIGILDWAVELVGPATVQALLTNDAIARANAEADILEAVKFGLARKG